MMAGGGIYGNSYDLRNDNYCFDIFAINDLQKNR